MKSTKEAEGNSRAVLSLAFSMLSEQSASRPTAAYWLRHKFFSPTLGDQQGMPAASSQTMPLTQQTPSSPLGTSLESKAMPEDRLPQNTYQALLNVHKLNPQLEPGELTMFVTEIPSHGQHSKSLLFHYILAVGKYQSFVRTCASNLGNLRQQFTTADLHRVCEQQW